jgi:RNA polymerase sigma-70 factor (ECF subfamily)
MNGVKNLNVEEKVLASNAGHQAESFMALYDLYFNRVYNYVRYRCYDPQVADDLTAQSFLKALSRISTYNADKAPFGAWLFAIVRNLVSDYYRHEKKYNLVDIEDAEFIVQPCENRDLEESAEQREEKIKMLQALDKLPSRQRDLIALKFGSEMTNRDIARLTGLTEQNVGVLVHRGIKTLRKHLQEGEKV